MLPRKLVLAAHFADFTAGGLPFNLSADPLQQRSSSSERWALSTDRRVPRVRVVEQLTHLPRYMESFGDDRTGLSKSNFIVWLATQTE